VSADSPVTAQTGGIFNVQVSWRLQEIR